MAFAERAVEACRHAMESGSVSESQVKSVLGCERADVSVIAKFMWSDSPMIRMMAARIIAKHGSIECLLEAAEKEKDGSVLRELLHLLGTRGEGVEALGNMLCSDDPTVREAAIDMYVASGKTDMLFPLLFDKDEHLVNRVKRYLRGKEENSGI